MSAPIKPSTSDISALERARQHLSRTYKASQHLPGLHAVSFQPLLTKQNQDRVVTLHWDISGQTWLFLAVCDGHAGSTTSEYTARRLPGRIHTALKSLSETMGKIDRATVGDGVAVSDMLSREVEAFDKHIGKALRKLCPRPDTLTGNDARALISDHTDVLQRANHGTTLAAALINVDEQFMWSIGVGDSTVAVTTVDNTDSPHGVRLNELHKPTNPQEYFRVSMTHPGEDERIVIRNSDRVLGALSLTRAIGDFSMKFHRHYTEKLLRYLPTTAHPDHIENIVEYNRTPPYIIATPSVNFVDLQPLWARRPTIMVFSDGVDALIEGYFVFHGPENACDADPVKVVSALLQDPIEPWVEATLGHRVQSRWEGSNTNRAVEVLNNLVGGTDISRIAKILDQTKLSDKTSVPAFRVDDTSIVLCDLSQLVVDAPGGQE